MEAAAARDGKRLLTFTIEAEVRLPEPADLERLAERLAAVLEEAAAEHPAGRPYRIVLGAHPTPGDPA